MLIRGNYTTLTYKFNYPSWYEDVVQNSLIYIWDSGKDRHVKQIDAYTFLFEHLKHFKTFSKLLFFIFKLIFSVFWLYLIFCLTTDALCYINSLFNNYYSIFDLNIFYDIYSSLFTTLNNFLSIACARVPHCEPPHHLLSITFSPSGRTEK